MIKNSAIYLILIVFVFSCSKDKLQNETKLINSSHLDALYEEIPLKSNKVGIIHIYSEYPDYKWVGDSDEGTACLDDAARAEIFYLKEYERTGNEEYLRKSKMLLRFILMLQDSNGYFNNFVWEDGKINTDFKTSVAGAGWWSWRALWALSESYPIVSDHDMDLALQIKNSMDKLVLNIKRDFKGAKDYQDIGGYKRPTWLPHGTASDQAALLVIGLTNYLKSNDDQKVMELVHNLCDGIISMQEGNKETFPYGSFLSWENTWHGWGNSQAFALLTAGEFFKKKEYIEAAVKEVKYFYPFMISSGFYNEFKLANNSEPEFIKYSQIAYGLRPMIFASLKAYDITKEDSYSQLAGKLACWFFGENDANQQVYFQATGICFDGINSENELNKNAGAESTVEALLALQMIENNESALQIVKDFIAAK